MCSSLCYLSSRRSSHQQCNSFSLLPHDAALCEALCALSCTIASVRYAFFPLLPRRRRGAMCCATSVISIHISSKFCATTSFYIAFHTTSNATAMQLFLRGVTSLRLQPTVCSSSLTQGITSLQQQFVLCNFRSLCRNYAVLFVRILLVLPSVHECSGPLQQYYCCRCIRDNRNLHFNVLHTPALRTIERHE